MSKVEKDCGGLRPTNMMTKQQFDKAKATANKKNAGKAGTKKK